MSSVVVEKAVESGTYDNFVASLPKSECRYAIFDFEYEKPGEGQRNKICFFAWWVYYITHAIQWRQMSMMLYHLVIDWYCYSYCYIYVNKELSLTMTICRAPDTAKIKQKMLYASSKDALRKKLVGIATEIQATDLSEIAYDVVLDKVSKQVSV